VIEFEPMTANQIKAIIFDIGGVLVRTMDRNPREKLAEKFGLTYKELDRIVFRSPTANQATKGEIKEEEHWRFISKFFHLDKTGTQNFYEDFWGGDQLNGEIISLIKMLKNKYQMGILSNAWSGARKFMTKRYGFLDLFNVVGFSAEIKIAKPDAHAYLWILERMNAIPEQTLFIDDFIENIESARELGIHSIHYKDNNQLISAFSHYLTD
jgi:epoxide hydrolase-like predicted phosphatase